MDFWPKSVVYSRSVGPTDHLMAILWIPKFVTIDIGCGVTPHTGSLACGVRTTSGKGHVEV